MSTFSTDCRKSCGSENLLLPAFEIYRSAFSLINGNHWDILDYRESIHTDITNSVTAYCTKTGVLTLQHDHPPKNLARAMVDVGLLLNSLASNETQIGEWVNVMGYVTSCLNQQLKGPGGSGNREINIQAIVLWSAKAFDLQGYERSLDEKKVSESTPLHYEPRESMAEERKI